MGDKKQTTLYVIATPLGNREDITFRAKAMFNQLTCFFAEDTRELRKLFELYEIPHAGKTFFSYAKHNMKEASEKALEALDKGIDVGLVSDRGTPAVSDPGAVLAREARDAGYLVVPLPGPSSVTCALSVSGFDADRFVFLGFLPTKAGEKTEWFDNASKLGLPICFFESPHRIKETLEHVKKQMPTSDIFIAREMTKMFETFIYSSVETLDVASIPEKGEFVVIVKPNEIPKSAEEWEAEVDLRLDTDKAWSKAVAARYGVSASDAYNALQKKKKERE